MSVIKTLLENEADLPDGEPITRKEKAKPPTPLRCSYCGSVATKEILNPVTSLQYSAIRCSDCGRHIKHGQNPAITKASEQRDHQILSILNNFELSHHEEKFLDGMLYKRFATVPQRNWMDALSMRFLGKFFDWSAYEKRPSE